MRNFVDEMCEAVLKSELPGVEKEKILERCRYLGNAPVNILVAGPTGSGKSSTINALMKREAAQVGSGVDPKTIDISRYDCGSIVLWDSPGLGDTPEADAAHTKKIVAKLNELDSDGNPLIDLVLVVLDGSSRDLGTTFDLISKVLAPALGNERNQRMIVAMNQADVAMKGRYYDSAANKPEDILLDFLNKKVRSADARIKESAGIETQTVFYSAGFKDRAAEQNTPYNLSALLLAIARHLPDKKREGNTPYPFHGAEVPYRLTRKVLAGNATDLFRTAHYFIYRCAGGWHRENTDGACDAIPLNVGSNPRIYGDSVWSVSVNGEALQALNVSDHSTRRLGKWTGSQVLDYNDRHVICETRTGTKSTLSAHEVLAPTKAGPTLALPRTTYVRGLVLDGKTAYMVLNNDALVSWDITTGKQNVVHSELWGWYGAPRIVCAANDIVYCSTNIPGQRTWGDMCRIDMRTGSAVRVSHKPNTKWIKCPEIVSDRYLIYAHSRMKSATLYVDDLASGMHRTVNLRHVNSGILRNLSLSGDILYGRDPNGQTYACDLTVNKLSLVFSRITR